MYDIILATVIKGIVKVTRINNTNAILDNYIELSKRYIDSTIEIDVSNDINRGVIQFAPLLHYTDRQIVNEIIMPHRKKPISRYADYKIKDIKNIGGTYIESDLEISNS